MATTRRTRIAEDISRRSMLLAYRSWHANESEEKNALEWARSTERRLRRLLADHKLPAKNAAAIEELVAMYRTAMLDPSGEDFRDATKAMKVEDEAEERQWLEKVVEVHLPRVRELKKYLREDPAAIDDPSYFLQDHPKWADEVSKPLQFKLTPTLAKALSKQEPLVWLLSRIAKIISTTPEALRKKLHTRPKKHR